MKKIILSMIAMFAITAVASAAEYTINDADVDALIENCVEASTIALNVENNAVIPAAAFGSGSPDAAVTLVLTYFLGWLGIHRHYLGTRPFMWLIYLVTFGGIFVIVPLIDFIFEIVAIVEGSGVGQFAGNTSFFMWL